MEAGSFESARHQLFYQLIHFVKKSPLVHDTSVNWEDKVFYQCVTINSSSAAPFSKISGDIETTISPSSKAPSTSMVHISVNLK